jgi:starch synthase
LTPEFGCGLEGFLDLHRNKFTGIVNGIDTEDFSPSTDSALIAPYTDLTGKTVNKKAYLKAIGLKGVKKPLFVFVGRFTWQKGMDLLIETLPKAASLPCNIAILGEGEAKYRDALKAIADDYPNIHLEFGYDESLSHRMYAAADFLLMPSLFEPCGLNQMIAMHYGGLAVVHHVGGLADTVEQEENFDQLTKRGYGIVFSKATVRSFFKAFGRSIELYDDKPRYNKIAKHNMRCDFSWRESAKAYKALYGKMMH